MECYCYLRYVQDLLADGNTLSKRKEHWKGHLKDRSCRFVLLFHPISSNDTARLHQFVSKVLPEIFTGYALNAGRSWTVDLLAVDAEDLNNLRAFEIPVKHVEVERSRSTNIT